MSEAEHVVHVGDLHRETSEPELNSLFSRYGEVSRIVNLRTRDGRLFALVSYKSKDSAERARKEANGEVIHEKHIRVSIYDQNATKNNDANIFVKNLPESVSGKDLDNRFSEFGEVVSSKICYDEQGRSRGYGFILFRTAEQAEKAVKEANNTDLCGQKLYVAKFIPREKRMNLKGAFNNVYVRGFGENFNENDLVKTFSEYGSITSPIVLKDTQGKSKKAGFICFSTPEEASRAVESHNEKEDPRGFKWFVARAMNKNERQFYLKEQFKLKQEDWKKRNLFVRNLPKDLTEDQIRKIFSEYGQIESLKLITVESYRVEEKLIPDQVSTGKAFVCFANPESAERALEQLRKKRIHDQEIRIVKWKPRSELIKSFPYGPNVNMMMPMGMGMPFGMGMPMPMMRGRGMQFAPNMYTPPMMYPFMEYQNWMSSGPKQGFRGRGSNFGSMPGRVPRDQQAQPPMRPQQLPPHPNMHLAETARNVPPVPQTVPLQFNKAAFQNATSTDEKRRILGEAIYHDLYPKFAAHTGKITGMLLDIPESELLQLANDRARLHAKADEAMEVLKKHMPINA